MKFDAASTISDALEHTLEAFRSGDFGRAEAEAEGALGLDFEHTGVQAALKCAVYWKDRMARVETLVAPEEKANLLMREWAGFSRRFREHLDEPFEEGIEAIRSSVFDRAAQGYLDQIPFEEGRKYELMLKAARAWKGMGSFDKALETLDQVLAGRPDDAGALAEMADCFEAVGEVQRAKLFFREAFYLNAQAVELESLRSPSLREVADAVAREGYTGAELKEWMAVYAVVRGVFSVKRDLKPLELGQLKQSINSLKAELRDTQPLVLPKLLNRYFWLIDHFFSVKEDRSKIEDVLLNIKLLDQKIYELYTH